MGENLAARSGEDGAGDSLLSANLRQEVIRDPDDVELRQRYLAIRSEHDRMADLNSVLWRWRLLYVAFALAICFAAGAAGKSVGHLFEEKFPSWWIFRIPVQAGAGALAATIVSFLAIVCCCLFLSREESRYSFGLSTGVIALGICNGLIGNSMAWGLGCVMIVFIYATENKAIKVGPLPFGSHIFLRGKMWRVFLKKRRS